MKALSASVSVLMVTGAVAVAHAVAEAPDFARYQVILARMPFGAEPVVQAGGATNAPPGPPAESFTKSLKMCAVTLNYITGKLQVGLVDAVTKKNYFLKVGEEEDGIRVVDADYEGEKALLKKGEEEVWITMSSGVGIAVAAVGAPRGAMPPLMGVPAPAPRSVARPGMPTAGAASEPSSNPSLSERIAAMRALRADAGAKGTIPGAKPVAMNDAASKAPAATDNNVSTRSPQELEKHLQDYQMDIIRSGGAKGPPLPLPLTPEMDQKLVEEGVLPPQ